MARAQDLIERLAALLQSHVDLVEAIENRALASLATGSSSQLREDLENLRRLRERIREDLKSLGKSNLQGEDLEDAWALAGFYVEAASRRERRALEKASKLIDTSRDLRELDEAVNQARRLMALKEGL